MFYKVFKEDSKVCQINQHCGNKGQWIFINIKTHWISMLFLAKSSQIYKLHGFTPNPCKVCYFIGSYWLNMNVVYYLNTKVVCMIFVCKQHK
jgi:hypothetical protein